MKIPLETVLGNSDTKIVDIACTVGSNLALTADGRAICWGTDASWLDDNQRFQEISSSWEIKLRHIDVEASTHFQLQRCKSEQDSLSKSQPVPSIRFPSVPITTTPTTSTTTTTTTAKSASAFATTSTTTATPGGGGSSLPFAQAQTGIQVRALNPQPQQELVPQLIIRPPLTPPTLEPPRPLRRTMPPSTAITVTPSTTRPASVPSIPNFSRVKSSEDIHLNTPNNNNDNTDTQGDNNTLKRPRPPLPPPRSPDATLSSTTSTTATTTSATSNHNNANRIVFSSRLQQLAVNKKIMAIACGVSHVLLVSTDGCVFSFGNGEAGALGHGSYTRDLQSPRLIQVYSSLYI